MGHIFLIQATPNDDLDILGRWTVQWILRNEIPIDTTLYTCVGLEQASMAIAEPLAQGTPPALVVIDHGEAGLVELDRQAVTDFGERLRACIPETWIVELVGTLSLLPKDLQQAFLVPKPVRRSDWEDVLRHIFLHAPTPQWSRALQT